MKFKHAAKQNQRIERITGDHLIIGIDIAKFNHVARATDFRGIERGKHLVFSNDLDGFQKLHAWVQSLKLQFNKTRVILGVEPTGHYWLNLAFWLKENHMELVLVNPLQVKRNKENRDNSPTKNDIKDALVIADMVKNGYYSELHLLPDQYRALRQLSTCREFVVKQFSSVTNQIHRWTDMYFPEFHLAFKDVTCKTALATLALFPLPSDLCGLTVQDIVASWKQHLKRAGNHSTAVTLLECAKRTSAVPGCLEEARLSIDLLLKQLELFKQQLSKIEEKMSTLISDIPMTNSLRVIAGISDITIATLYSEAGDLRRFEHGRQLLRLAGLHLSENSSGTIKGKVKVTKRGRPKLRKTLFLTVMNMVSVNPEFRTLHQYNKHVKKMSAMQSLMRLIGKLARILVAMARQNIPYNVNRVLNIA
ncbi:IS110 family RNA-guided transposase [Cohnella cholangitidis]|uniref:IS110 family transposase n=1 Tax=Cohnella cholangitidis TaxID=2598458 RepID=A0A7G5C0L7_9BACL|nr:IS110 family transposase [Cohnella cholangitidis]QMV41201.1 IS110 family transposase [Cohnella cholangitidis]QMV42751.1 IS110 family transposase [Cohnella cholangitidis]